MKKIAMALALGVLAVCGALGVGCGGPDNVGACKDYVATVNGLDCIGDAKISDMFCDVYKDIICDVVVYFDCFLPIYVCKDGALDPAELAKQSDCTSLATCN